MCLCRRIYKDMNNKVTAFPLIFLIESFCLDILLKIIYVKALQDEKKNNGNAATFVTYIHPSVGANSYRLNTALFETGFIYQGISSFLKRERKNFRLVFYLRCVSS